MIVVSDSSPLITLSRIDCLDLVRTLFPLIHVPTEVYNEVVIAGAGLPGAQEVANASWIRVAGVDDTEALQAAIEETGLGAGEVAVIQLAQQMGSSVVLIDERKARRYAERENLICFGCVGILEMLYQNESVTDLPECYRQLLEMDFRIDTKALRSSLEKFGFRPL